MSETLPTWVKEAIEELHDHLFLFVGIREWRSLAEEIFARHYEKDHDDGRY
jgi:hypothetical protein